MVSKDHLDAFNEIVSSLSEFDEETQKHILDTVFNWLGFATFISPQAPALQVAKNPAAKSPYNYSEEAEQSSKEFLLEKEPNTNVERVVCLAYYLTHYRGIPHFKTLDISKLNTEAAQPKFANPSVALNDTAKAGLVVASTKGAKQLSAMGEQFVMALPDREEAKKIQKKMKPRRKRKNPVKKASTKLSEIVVDGNAYAQTT